MTMPDLPAAAREIATPVLHYFVQLPGEPRKILCNPYHTIRSVTWTTNIACVTCKVCMKRLHAMKMVGEDLRC